MDGTWISVRDDLPEYGQRVIWYDVNLGMCLENRGPDKYPLPDSITHWCLPPFPPNT